SPFKASGRRTPLGLIALVLPAWPARLDLASFRGHLRCIAQLRTPASPARVGLLIFEDLSVEAAGPSRFIRCPDTRGGARSTPAVSISRFYRDWRCAVL